ncbi:MAG: hypothetical protein FJ202_12020, partial [Gemmatimonadetes bacterium]|nr:hypothetical protein [Gemmatimonadota bacterium]
MNKGILEVPNRNNPDVERAYSTPAGIEGVISGTFLQVWSASMSCTDCVPHQARMLALETYSELGNNGNGTRSQIPRGPILNDRSIEQGGANFALYSALSRATRTAANGLQALDRLVKANGTLGSAAQDARGRMFAMFVNGVALGGLALTYDSAGIVVNTTPSDAVPPLSPYPAVAAAAMQMLDSAIAIANGTAILSGANGFPIPATWINGNAMDKARFISLVRSYKAKFRAGVARTPAERGAADWNAILADAQNGVATDFIVTIAGTGGWGSPYVNAQPSGGLLSMLYYGMSDTSGAFANFIASPMATRDGGFLIRTPDLRWPQGATRTAQQLDTQALPLPGRRYFRNRPTGEDLPVLGYGFSMYEARRFAGIAINSTNGPYTMINKVEMDMLV